MRFDPLDATTVELYAQGVAQGTARLVDPVVNAQRPAAKPGASAAPAPTGINYVELLRQAPADPGAEEQGKAADQQQEEER